MKGKFYILNLVISCEMLIETLMDGMKQVILVKQDF